MSVDEASAPAGLAERERDAIEAIEAALDANDSRGASDLAEAERAHGARGALVLHRVAERRQDSGRFLEALDLLQRARALAPDDAEILNDIGNCCHNLGRDVEAVDAFDAALSIEPDMLAALCNKAAVFALGGDRATAASLYERAILIHPEAAAPPAALALMLARTGDAAQARPYAVRALVCDRSNVQAHLALAHVDVANRAFAAAEARLRSLVAEPRLPALERSLAYNLLGNALDGLDLPTEAYAAYAQGNQVRAAMPAERATEAPSHRARRLQRYFATARQEDWRRAPGPDAEGAARARGHAFLLGFPRSGTTLLEHALGSHPGVVSLEETDALDASTLEWMADDAALDRLARITPAEADEWRAQYWRRVAQMVDLGGGGKVVVDKGPLHTMSLPLIAKLFPDARVLFAVRDPRDVVFSCFRRRATLTIEIDEFATPEKAAVFYGEVMSLARRYLSMLKLDVRQVVHEEVVRDFRGCVTGALRFIGLDWDPAVEAFPARARAQSRTASVAQVARGLNSEGVGQWRRYAAQLGPALELLQPWVSHFGYDDAAPAAHTRSPPPRTEADLAARLEEALFMTQRAINIGDWARAFDVCESALTNGLEHPLFYKLRAVRHEQRGAPDLAIADFEHVLAEAPSDLGVLNALGLCLAKVGRTGEAIDRLDAAVAIDPAFAPAHYNRGWTLENMGDLAGAKAAYARAVELDPRHAQALANLAHLSARTAAWEDGSALAGRALALDPAQPTALIALAQIELATGELATAELRLKRLLADQARPSLHDRSVALSALADVYDKQDRPADAFEAYSRANAGLRTLNAPRISGGGRDSGYARVLRLAAEIGQTSAADWRRAQADAPAARHAFIVGFPRSGTTLMGQLLAAQPGVVTLDEVETLVDSSQAFLNRPNGLAQLARADDEVLESYRQAYWRRVRASGADVDGKTFVDKLPMNSLGLPLIARLFPQAKVIFARRDPRDVVLSAFRRQFVINSATWELLTLGGAARFYDAVMRLCDLYLERLELSVRIQSYEALAAAPEVEGGALANYLDVEWVGLEALGAGVRSGRVATPSSAEIASRLHDESAGQWRRYREQMLPVLPILEPWVERFGYSAS